MQTFVQKGKVNYWNVHTNTNPNTSFISVQSHIAQSISQTSGRCQGTKRHILPGEQRAKKDTCVAKPKANHRNILAIAFTWGDQMSFLECKSSSTASTGFHVMKYNQMSAEMAKDTALPWHFCLGPFLETPPFLAEVQG